MVLNKIIRNIEKIIRTANSQVKYDFIILYKT